MKQEVALARFARWFLRVLSHSAYLYGAAPVMEQFRTQWNRPWVPFPSRAHGFGRGRTIETFTTMRESSALVVQKGISDPLHPNPSSGARSQGKRRQPDHLLVQWYSLIQGTRGVRRPEESGRVISIGSVTPQMRKCLQRSSGGNFVPHTSAVNVRGSLTAECTNKYPPFLGCRGEPEMASS